MAAPSLLQTTHSLGLPVRDFNDVFPTIGPIVGRGDCGVVYAVKDSEPPRVYKVIPKASLTSQEVHIAQIAGDIGVGPKVHAAFKTAERERNYVFIEMDHAGQTLGKHMEDLAPEPQPEPEPEPVVLTPEEQEREEMIRKIQKKYAAKSKFTIVAIPTKARVSIQEAAERLYLKQEDLYYELFSKIKRLAEENISYGDCHVGNILPNPGTEKGMQLIDFDGAQIMGSTKEAASKSMQSAYTGLLFGQFLQISDLSDRSRELIQWFKG